MGCRWVTRGGRRMRAAPVEGPRSAISIGMMSVASFLIKIGISFIHASPALTLEELQEATLHLWKDPELGYIMEARLTPSSTPIYHSITTAEATAFEAGRPAPEFIARMFHLVNVEDTLN